MIIVEGGLVIDPRNNREDFADVLVEDGIIKAVAAPGTFRSLDAPLRIDARNLWVCPGLIDIHVHLREPGFEWKETIESGARAAVGGGFTSVCCMPNTIPRIERGEVAQFVRARAAAAGLARVYPIGAITVNLEGTQLTPLYELVEAGCVAFSDDGEPVGSALMMLRALEIARTLGVPLTCHEEVKSLTRGGSMNESSLSMALGLTGMPRVAEDLMVARDIELARISGGHVHFCHVSTGRSVELIRRAKNEGIPVTGEVTPHHLLLTEAEVGEYNTNAKMSPPLRLAEDVEACVQGLVDGTLDAVASDHAPHEEDSKRVPFSEASFGILGLQTTLPLLLRLVHGERLSRHRCIESMTSSPAKVFGLPGGTLSEGAPADITIIAPDHVWHFNEASCYSKSKNSPFWGQEMVGAAHTVMVGGAVVVKEFSPERREVTPNCSLK